MHREGETRYTGNVNFSSQTAVAEFHEWEISIRGGLQTSWLGV